MKRRTQNTLLICLSILLAVGALLTRTTVYAASYFGGMRTATFSCSCSGSTLMYITNYSGGGSSSLALIYDGSGRVFSNNNPYGTYLLGSYTSGGSCMYIAGEDCLEMQSDGRFDSNPGIGTT